MGAWKLIEAVNHVLKAGGEAPVNSLTSDSASSVSIVVGMLKEERINTLIRGQLFNTRYPYLEPDVNGNILIGDIILSVDGWQEHVDIQFTEVQGKLFNVSDQTDIFTGSVHLKIIYDDVFDNIPTAMQFQIMSSAAKTFQRRYQQDQFTDVDLSEKEADAQLRATEVELRGSNIDPKANTPLGRILNKGILGYD